MGHCSGLSPERLLHSSRISGSASFVILVEKFSNKVLLRVSRARIIVNGLGHCSGLTPEGREFGYDVGSTSLVTTQRCLPILRSRTNPSFS
jgi:hypothetical protein